MDLIGFCMGQIVMARSLIVSCEMYFKRASQWGMWLLAMFNCKTFGPAIHVDITLTFATNLHIAVNQPLHGYAIP